MRKTIMLLAILALGTGLSAQRRVAYELTIGDTVVNHGGRPRPAMAINGRIPAPALTFTEGDTAVITIRNHSQAATSLHWHGILVPNRFDGVPYLTSDPIAPGRSVTYEFPIIQNGTYWYHSHSGLLEQIGLHGAFVIRKKRQAREFDALPERTILLSDWTGIRPMEVNRRLHAGSDWAAIRKGSVQSYGEALIEGRFGTKLASEWKRMNAMDVSDVHYDAFLANGAREVNLSDLAPGSRVRLRIINGGGSTYFWLRYAGGKMTVVAADGMDVEPVEVDRMLVAVSETYDIVVTVPHNGAAELQATAEDRSGWTSVWVGGGMRHGLEPLPKLDYFAGMKMMNGMMRMNGDIDVGGMAMGLQKMDMNRVMYRELRSPTQAAAHAGHTASAAAPDSAAIPAAAAAAAAMNHGGHEGHAAMSVEMSPGWHESHATPRTGGPVTLNYDMLRSTASTALPDGPWRELRMELGGNMDRYVWTIDGKTAAESDKILIREGENLRLVIHNNTMMRHPMHLHGHFFRLVNSHGDRSPLKFSVDLMPGEADTLEFRAAEPSRGDWFFHCHILYHMMSGMGRIFSYADSPPNPAQDMRKVHADRMFYLTARNDFLSSGNIGRAEYSNIRWSFQAEWLSAYGRRREHEAEIVAGRYIGRMQRLMPFVGAEWSYRHGAGKNMLGQSLAAGGRFSGVAGVRYTLPLLIVAEARVDTRGRVRFGLEREDIALTNRLRMDLSANTDREWSVGLNYILTPWLGVTGNYHSHLRWGLGVRLTY